MADESYSVKINRRDGIIEITGPDKDWIAEQLDKLAPVYTRELQGGDEPVAPPAATVQGAENQPSGEGAKEPTRKSRARRSTPRAVGPSEVEKALTRDVLTKLHTYMGERDESKIKSQPDRAAVITTFVQDEMKIDSIGSADLLAVYRAMGWSPPKNPSGVIKNAIDRRGYFSGWRDGKVYLTPTGEHFGRHGSKEPPPDKK